MGGGINEVEMAYLFTLPTHCYFHIKALHHIWKSLPDDVAKMVACSIVSLRLDYCNSLLPRCLRQTLWNDSEYGTLLHASWPASRSDHIISVLADLHWLLVKSRVMFNCITDILHLQSEPTYLRMLIPEYKPSLSASMNYYYFISTLGATSMCNMKVTNIHITNNMT